VTSVIVGLLATFSFGLDVARHNATREMWNMGIFDSRPRCVEGSPDGYVYLMRCPGTFDRCDVLTYREESASK
jgi:hypothetical protein